MSPRPSPPSRRDPAVAAILRAWRSLTADRPGGRRTIVACSGGADSSALVLALASSPDARRELVVAHIVHDQRPAAEALADRDAVSSLAASLELPFAEGRAVARGQPGNLEANMRRARYRALARIARAHDARFVATAHHAHDQVETVLMAMLRGAGPRGLGGIAPSRPLDRAGTTQLIRPMLSIDPEEARRLCRACGWAWREDPTNDDQSRLRARVRRTVLPAILAIRPDAARRVSAAATSAREAHRAVAAAADPVWSVSESRRDADGRLTGLAWPRSILVRSPAAVIGEVLRRASRALRRGRGADRLGRAHADAVIRGLSRGRTRGTIHWPGLDIRFLGSTVEVALRLVEPETPTASRVCTPRAGTTPRASASGR